jgi:hypothetical protein
MTVEARNIRPTRHMVEPTPRFAIDPENLLDSANAIIRAIISLDNARWSGVLLFVDPQRNAYLISADRTVGERWTRERLGWLVGAYRIRATSPTPKLELSVSGLVEDLEEHLRGLVA